MAAKNQQTLIFKDINLKFGIYLSITIQNKMAKGKSDFFKKGTININTLLVLEIHF